MPSSHGIFLAERVGFEPTMGTRPITVFETAPINHSGISPTGFRLYLKVELLPLFSVDRHRQFGVLSQLVDPAPGLYPARRGRG